MIILKTDCLCERNSIDNSNWKSSAFCSIKEKQKRVRITIIRSESFPIRILSEFFLLTISALTILLMINKEHLNYIPVAEKINLRAGRSTGRTNISFLPAPFLPTAEMYAWSGDFRQLFEMLSTSGATTIIASKSVDCSAKYLVFVSSHSVKLREHSFAQSVYFLRKVCLFFNFWMIKCTIMSNKT